MLQRYDNLLGFGFYYFTWKAWGLKTVGNKLLLCDAKPKSEVFPFLGICKY